MMDEELEEQSLDDQLDDLEELKSWSDGAVLWSTDWTAETILSQLNRGNINLDPVFQRRSAWTPKKQSLFVESLILGLPIPQLILAEDPNKKGAYIVIDGKQRLLALRMFAARENDGFDTLRLTGLNELNELNGKTYASILENPDLNEELSSFENASIRTVVIRNWKQEAYLYEVFLRINTGSVQLSPQELRQALHPGPFSIFVDEASANSSGLKRALGLKKPDFRMRDAEVLLRYIAYQNFAASYRGNLKLFLDDTTRELNNGWPKYQHTVEAQTLEMEAAFDATEQIFGEKDYLRKWNGVEFERQKNRAVFDIMLYYFSDENVREAALGKPVAVKEKFIELCSEDTDFLASIERTTKSVEANQFRFNKWAVELTKTLDMQISSPFAE